MFCPACGKSLEEGKTFCKYCGARIVPDGATTIMPPPPPPPAGWTPPPPPPPPPEWAVPPPPPPRSGSKAGRLIVVIAIAAVLLLGGGVAAAVFLFASSESEGGRTQTSGVVVVTTLSPDVIPTNTEVPGTATTATIPGFDPDGTAGTQPSTDATVDSAGYLEALGGLEKVLAHCDERIPVLAAEINGSAPSVPGSVSQEIDGLYADVEEARSALSEFEAPAPYEQADQLIFEAADAMQNRIDQTSKGIDAMWNDGTVAAGTPYFEEGRKARDEYHALYDQYAAAYPR